MKSFKIKNINLDFCVDSTIHIQSDKKINSIVLGALNTNLMFVTIFIESELCFI